MPSDKNQKEVFDFLVGHLESKEPFALGELEQRTDWKGQTFETYLNKQLRQFVVPIEGRPGLYRISEAFRRYSVWEKFQQHVTQVRRANDYRPLKYNIVRVYEFFLPLTNEAYLRAALDTLFYKDTIQAQLRTIEPSKLQAIFPQGSEESDSSYDNRLCEWLSGKFGGYSIYHVSGRFRALPLTARKEIPENARYLVDETTAVTRFIFPCESLEEAKQVEFFFTTLFVQAIIEAISGEDEIWMVETGLESRLHIWRAYSDASSKTAKKPKRSKSDTLDESV